LSSGSSISGPQFGRLRRAVTILLLIGAVAQVFDGITTWIGLSSGLHETFTLSANALSVFGLAGLVAVKVFVVFVFYFIWRVLKWYWMKMQAWQVYSAVIIAGFLAVVTCYAVLSNLTFILAKLTP
jgi:hypothetical protein